ncbi:MAG: sigma 54-interacting transcriptional regulator [Verrucomicrobiota bacterium]
MSWPTAARSSSTRSASCRPEVQVTLLRVLQEREFERVGGTELIRVNVRVITATHRDLRAEMAAGKFRSDLFYRLNVFPLEVPPLRERREDIPALAQFFVERVAGRLGKSVRCIDAGAMRLLQAYAWPGNIRELQNVIERSVITCDGGTLFVDEACLRAEAPLSRTRTQHLGARIAEQEREMIEEALRECRGRVAGPWGAAVRLGMPALHARFQDRIAQD